MSTYSASTAHVDNGGTATCTYPGPGSMYGSAVHLPRQTRVLPNGPGGSDRIVLNGMRGPTGLNASAGRDSFGSGARSSSKSFSSSFPTSFGAAGEAMSLPASERARPAQAARISPLDAVPVNADGVHNQDVSMNLPSSSMAGSEAKTINGTTQLNSTAPIHPMASMESADAHHRYIFDGQNCGKDHEVHISSQHRGESPFSMSRMDSEMDMKDGANHSNQQLHKCESCSKVYRHPSCLVKHRWEHTMYWKEASKFLMSKHQQVQLLEAAAILVGMDSNARSLPEEKALWPAAVSPPSSGLLGCDQVNFEKLMASKTRNTSGGPKTPSMAYGASAPAQSAALGNFHGASYQRGARRSDRSSDEDVEEEDTPADVEDVHAREGVYGLSSGGDVMADMDMDAD
ncbi:hypothetical protein MVES1_003510 [Malassezia vespertilionis]|uniref:uncharacterized protein n=1 Tax=Malassezia vespertilionis TaxID=2020962 RepID=UPI0024B25B2D|nr:uncharacterized protein MVES1_003510 [Malassezia vespertilionis]WFD08140.1 hypothetical protein MVES1_003510 [Malassezia vespertilionis]